MNDPKTEKKLEEIEAQFVTMANFLSTLYNSGNLENISGQGWEELIRELFQSKPVTDVKHVHLETAIGDLYLKGNVGIYLALITGELITNALKYAFPNQRPGAIFVSLQQDPDTHEMELIFRDNGVGFAEGTFQGRPNSLGTQLIDDLGRRQLKGTLEGVNLPEGGSQITLRFPAPLNR